MHTTNLLPRRSLLALPALALLQGCSAPLPPVTDAASSPDAQRLLADSAAAHGAANLPGITDISVGYAGRWRALVGSIQPDLVDSGFRGRSEEHWLLQDRVVAQAHLGPDGRKQVFRRMGAASQGTVRVWFNQQETQDRDKLAAAALVVDGYSLFLLGPMLLAGQWTADRSLVLEYGGTARLTQDKRDFDCDILRARMTPGFGLSDMDQLAVYIDREEKLMRRVRFSLNGLDSTRGAVAEVDTMDHFNLHGLRWPTRFQERLLRPVPLPVHDWRMTGLDVNRGLTVADVEGLAFSGKAVPEAAALGT